MKKINKKKVARNVGLLFTVVATATTLACKPDPTCECPAGTVHVTGESCGVENGCQCEHAEGVRIKGIAVTNRGVTTAEFEIKKTQVTNALSTFSGAKETFIMNTIKEIKITNAVSGDITVTAGVMTVRVGCGAGDIITFLNSYTSSITMLQQFDNSKETVRLASKLVPSNLRFGTVFA